MTKPEDSAEPPRPWWRRPRMLGLALAGMLVAGALGADWWSCLPDDVEPRYVGRQTCAECHAGQHRAWTGSHHDLAMDHATTESVLGDFNDAELTYHGITARMFRREGRFFVHTEGPDGKLADFEVKFVLGVEPLQQYLVEFDRSERGSGFQPESSAAIHSGSKPEPRSGRPADLAANQVGRLQVLRESWDTTRRKWFYLPPPDVREKLAPDDDLHWTGIAQRWNNMCADCHTTNLERKFDVKSGTYHTTFSESDVSCEACHGPGSVHVELARSRSVFWDRKHGYGLARLKGRDPEPQLQTCAQCHARRGIVHPGFRGGTPFADCYALELLTEQSYYADGQVKDEVYEYGSFLQSKMYHKGIRCTDCHDPHTARLKHEGNKLCTSCHAHSPGKYDSPAHHHHKPDSRGALCVSCHMPTTTYMEVDPRRDHSLRIPRPDLSVDLGTPNACSGCHVEREKLPPETRLGLRDYSDWLRAAEEGNDDVRRELDRVNHWSLRQVTLWYGEKPDRERHFAYALAAARRGEPTAELQLLDVLKNRRWPSIVRATALLELGQFSGRKTLDATVKALAEPHPMLRATALNNLQPLAPEELFDHRLAVLPLLSDPVRHVRVEAARLVTRLPPSQLTGSQRQARDSVLAELRVGLAENADRAAAHLAEGLLRESLGEREAALDAYFAALKVEPHATGARANLAALLETMAEDAARRAAAAVRQGTSDERSQKSAEELLEKAKTLRFEELGNLARDARLAPRNAAVVHRFGLSLYYHGKQDEAERALRLAYDLEPNVPQYVLGLALFFQKFGRYAEALPLAERLTELRPDDNVYAQLLVDLRYQSRQNRPAETERGPRDK